MRTVGKASRNCTGMVQIFPGGLTYMGPPKSVLFHTVSGTACFQACDWPSITANRSTGVRRRRVARAVACLWQGVTPCSHGRRASRRLDPEAKDDGEHDDGRVSMGMKTNKVQALSLYPPGVDRRSTENPWSLSLYICGRMWVCHIPGGVWSWPHCKGSRIPWMRRWWPPRAHHGSAWPGNKKHRVCRYSRTGPVAFSYCSARPRSPFLAAVGR